MHGCPPVYKCGIGALKQMVSSFLRQSSLRYIDTWILVNSAFSLFHRAAAAQIRPQPPTWAPRKLSVRRVRTFRLWTQKPVHGNWGRGFCSLVMLSPRRLRKTHRVIHTTGVLIYSPEAKRETHRDRTHPSHPNACGNCGQRPKRIDPTLRVAE